MNDSPSSHRGAFVLLLEKDPTLAAELERAIAAAGVHVLGPARSIDEADALIRRLRQRPTAVVAGTSLYDAPDGPVGRAIAGLDRPLLLIGGTGGDDADPASIVHGEEVADRLRLLTHAGRSAAI